jgi:hypothetical protein
MRYADAIKLTRSVSEEVADVISAARPRRKPRSKRQAVTHHKAVCDGIIGALADEIVEIAAPGKAGVLAETVAVSLMVEVERRMVAGEC